MLEQLQKYLSVAKGHLAKAIADGEERAIIAYKGMVSDFEDEILAFQMTGKIRY